MVTINDIAKVTGFSVMTVSRVLNESEKVKEDTRKKIMHAVEKLGYVQNRGARSLAMGKAFNIYLYIPETLDCTETFVAQTVSAIGERLGSLGYSLSVRRQMQSNGNCDGIIAMGLNIEDESEFMRISEEKPALLYGNSSVFGNWVDVDNYKGIYDMTRYIIEKGYKRIAYVGMDFNAHYVEQRKRGFVDAMRDGGLSVEENLVVISDNTEVAGFNAGEKLLAANPPEAVVCATDLIAVGCMHAFQRKKVQIPQQIAVSGFDGFGFEKTVFPKLTTVKQPLYKMGIKLADVIVDMINGRIMEKGEYVEPEIIEGESI